MLVTRTNLRQALFGLWLHAVTQLSYSKLNNVFSLAVLLLH